MQKLKEEDFVSVAVPNSMRIDIMIAASNENKSISSWMQAAIENALERSRKEKE